MSLLQGRGEGKGINGRFVKLSLSLCERVCIVRGKKKKEKRGNLP